MNHPVNKLKLVLDADGVFTVGDVREGDQAPFANAGRLHRSFYHKDVVAAMGEIIAEEAVETAWISTQERGTAELNKEFGWPPIRYLKIQRDRYYSAAPPMRNKLIALREYVGTAPFVWVDDEIDGGEEIDGNIREEVDVEFSQPHLMIAPKRNTGLTMPDVHNIRSFIGNLTLTD